MNTMLFFVGLGTLFWLVQDDINDAIASLFEAWSPPFESTNAARQAMEQQRRFNKENGNA